MPLKSIPKGATKKVIDTITSDNIAELVKSGKPQNQAVAIAKQWEEDCLKKNKEAMAANLNSPIHKNVTDAHTCMDATVKAIAEMDPANITLEDMKAHMENLSKLGSKVWMAKDKLAQKAGL